MTKPQEIRIRAFLKGIIAAHGYNRQREGETFEEQTRRIFRRSHHLRLNAEDALDILCETWPEENA